MCRLFETLWAVAYQAPLSMGFSRQEYWSGMPFPSPRDLPDPGIEPRSPTLQADALPSEPPGKPNFLEIHPSCRLCQEPSCYCWVVFHLMAAEQLFSKNCKQMLYRLSHQGSHSYTVWFNTQLGLILHTSLWFLYILTAFVLNYLPRDVWTYRE